MRLAVAAILIGFLLGACAQPSVEDRMWSQRLAACESGYEPKDPEFKMNLAYHCHWVRICADPARRHECDS